MLVLDEDVVEVVAPDVSEVVDELFDFEADRVDGFLVSDGEGEGDNLFGFERGGRSGEELGYD